MTAVTAARAPLASVTPRFSVVPGLSRQRDELLGTAVASGIAAEGGMRHGQGRDVSGTQGMSPLYRVGDHMGAMHPGAVSGYPAVVVRPLGGAASELERRRSRCRPGLVCLWVCTPWWASTVVRGLVSVTGWARRTELLAGIPTAQAMPEASPRRFLQTPHWGTGR